MHCFNIKDMNGIVLYKNDRCVIWTPTGLDKCWLVDYDRDSNIVTIDTMRVMELERDQYQYDPRYFYKQ